jgi:hypothetical protein
MTSRRFIANPVPVALNPERKHFSVQVKNGRMSGQSRHSDLAAMTSGLPRRTDILSAVGMPQTCQSRKSRSSCQPKRQDVWW